MGKVIPHLRLSKEQVLMIVLEWYTEGMCPDIFQNEDGVDLEEYVQSGLDSIQKEKDKRWGK